MTRSEPPQRPQPAGPPAQQYTPGQYPTPQFPLPNNPPASDGSLSSLNEYGQPVPGIDSSTIALPTGQNSSPAAGVAAPPEQTPVRPNRRPTRIGAAWVALIVAAVVMIFLLIFIVQNSGPVQIRYFGFEGTVSLGVAMLFAAVAGALTAGLLGTVRILQLRKKNRQALAGK